jgi:hypothetical protein
VDCLSHIVRREGGVAALWRGGGPAVQRAALVNLVGARDSPPGGQQHMRRAVATTPAKGLCSAQHPWPCTRLVLHCCGRGVAWGLSCRPGRAICCRHPLLFRRS